jgi:hypothetical protein
MSFWLGYFEGVMTVLVILVGAVWYAGRDLL